MQSERLLDPLVDPVTIISVVACKSFKFLQQNYNTACLNKVKSVIALHTKLWTFY